MQIWPYIQIWQPRANLAKANLANLAIYKRAIKGYLWGGKSVKANIPLCQYELAARPVIYFSPVIVLQISFTCLFSTFLCVRFRPFHGHFGPVWPLLCSPVGPKIRISQPENTGNPTFSANFAIFWNLRPLCIILGDSATLRSHLGPPMGPPMGPPPGTPPLGPHWDPPGTPLGHTWDHPGTTLVPHWDHTGHPMGPPLDPPGTPKRGAQTSAVVGLYGQYGLAAGP